jgi:hypothetical protein
MTETFNKEPTGSWKASETSSNQTGRVQWQAWGQTRRIIVREGDRQCTLTGGHVSRQASRRTSRAGAFSRKVT